MSQGYSLQDLDSAQDLIGELFEEVSALEVKLDGGEKLGLGAGASALNSLRESKVAFGNPKDNLRTLIKRSFDDANAQLTEKYQMQMTDQFDFYYFTQNVRLWPERGTQWKLLECSLDFGPKGPNESIVQNYFPQRVWHDVLKWGGAMQLGLDGKLEWEIGLDSSGLLDAISDELPGDLKAKIVNKNAMKSFITVPDYSFALGRSEIEAAGEGASECLWRIQTPDLQKTQSVKFEAVFKAPKGTKSVELIGLAIAEPKISWLTENLGNVADYLSKRLQGVLRGEERLPIGAHEKWTIDLPS